MFYKCYKATWMKNAEPNGAHIAISASKQTGDLYKPWYLAHTHTCS